jgi:hypothetical protein
MHCAASLSISVPIAYLFERTRSATRWPSLLNDLRSSSGSSSALTWPRQQMHQHTQYISLACSKLSSMLHVSLTASAILMRCVERCALQTNRRNKANKQTESAQRHQVIKALPRSQLGTNACTSTCMWLTTREYRN